MTGRRVTVALAIVVLTGGFGVACSSTDEGDQPRAGLTTQLSPSTGTDWAKSECDGGPTEPIGFLSSEAVDAGTAVWEALQQGKLGTVLLPPDEIPDSVCFNAEVKDLVLVADIDEGHLLQKDDVSTRAVP